MFAIGDKDWAGLSKLSEECGELTQVIGKLMGTRGQEEHWDGTNLTERLLEEMSDVQAALDFVLGNNPFTDEQKLEVKRRTVQKLILFQEWHNNEDPPLRKYRTPTSDAEASEMME